MDPASSQKQTVAHLPLCAAADGSCSAIRQQWPRAGGLAAARDLTNARSRVPGYGVVA